MSILLGRSDDARARPSSLIKDDAVYYELFSEQMPIQVYSYAGLLIKKIEAVLLGRADLSSGDRNNIRFYVAVFVSWMMTKRVNPTAGDIAKIDTNDVTDGMLMDAVETVKAAYVELGANDQIAKGQELKKAIRSAAATALAGR